MSALTFNSYAGQEGGGGGIGISTPQGIYLYDFLEAGIEENAYINTSLPDQMNATLGVQNTMASPEVQRLIINKLNEVYIIAPEAALKLVDVIKTYQWRYVLPKVKETQDRGYTPIRVENQQLQIAFRDDNYKVVTIDREYLKKMSLYHQVGLYFHEILYSMTFSECADWTRSVSSCSVKESLYGHHDPHKTSYRARMFTAYLFHPSFKIQTTETFTNFYNSTMISQPNAQESFIPLTIFQLINSGEFKHQCNQFKAEINQAMMEGGDAFTKMYNQVLKVYVDASKQSSKKGRTCYSFDSDFDYISYHSTIEWNINNNSFYYPIRASIIRQNIKLCGKFQKIKFDRERVKKAAARFKELKDKHKNQFFDQCIQDDNILKVISAYSNLTLTDN